MTFRTTVIAIIWLVACYGCASIQYGSAKRSLNRIKAYAKDHPEFMDSLGWIQKDSLKTSGLHDEIDFAGTEDTTKIDSMSIQLTKLIAGSALRIGDNWNEPVWNDSARAQMVFTKGKSGSLTDILGGTLEKSPELLKKQIRDLRKALATAGCPKFKKDTVYNFTVIYGKDTIKVPINISVSVQKDKGSVKIDANQTKKVYTKKIIEVDIKKPKEFFTDPWFWASSVMFLLFILLIIISLKK